VPKTLSDSSRLPDARVSALLSPERAIGAATKANQNCRAFLRRLCTVKILTAPYYEYYVDMRLTLDTHPLRQWPSLQRSLIDAYNSLLASLRSQCDGLLSTL